MNYKEDSQEIVLRRGSILSSNTYFNSFYEQFYSKYTNIGSVYFLLKLEGDFKISVNREIYGSNSRELISIEKFEKCQLSESVKVLLPNLLQNETPKGRVYFEIQCLSESGSFQEGVIATEQEKNREVSLGIISCTFKKEDYINNTLDTILNDKFLATKTFKIFVVDNGKTLSKNNFKSAKVQLISNKNVGGSGGFTRGLFEALQEDTYSHFLFMDDDIELDSESIYRLFFLYEYAKFDFAVAGSMLDLYKKHILYEAGLSYGKASNDIELKPFAIVPRKRNLDLHLADSLNVLLAEENIDFGGFYFFAFSKEIFEKIGCPLPFFIKVDDIEFCLRIKENFGDKIVAFPSIAVWHEPCEVKVPVWDNYYYYRNDLITHAIHGMVSYINAVKHITKEVFSSLFLFDYNSAELLVKAFEDYLKGPDFLLTNDPEVLHSNILKLSKSYKSQNIQHNYSPPNNQIEPKSRAGSIRKLVSLLTINGHLLPNFLTSDDDVFIWQSPGYAGQPSKAFAKKRVLIFKEGTTCLFKNEIDKLAGIKILIRWLKLVAESSTKWSYIVEKWKISSKELTSTNFWQQYLGL